MRKNLVERTFIQMRRCVLRGEGKTDCVPLSADPSWHWRFGAMLVLLLTFVGVAMGAEGEESVFVPSVTVEREPGGAAVTVSFRIGKGGYIHEESLAVSVDGAAVEFLYGDKAVEQDGEWVFMEDFRRVYRASGHLADTVAVTVSYAGCLSSGVCLMPEERQFRVTLGASSGASASAMQDTAAKSESGCVSVKEVARLVGYEDAESFLAWLSGGDAVDSGHDENALVRAFRAGGFLWASLLVVLWGILLNLTPCVLPMIPVTLAILGAGSRAPSRRRGFSLGLLYGVGMALSYGVLGVAVVFTGGQFGSLNGQWWFNGAVALVFLFLGLAMFDVFSLDLSRFRVGRLRVQGGGRLAGAFCMGALSAVLAGACVAPVLIWVLVLSADLYGGGYAEGLALPFFLGAGMGLPWPLLGSGVSMLPRGGRWMVRLRQAFGVMIVLLGVYYGFVCFRQVVPASYHAEQDGVWMTDWTAARRRAAAEKKPILVDVWGTACKNCVLMDERVLSRADVQSALSEFVCVKIQGDAAENRPLMDSWKVVGFPTYLIMRLDGKEEARR